jgi:hypothetical protein
MLSMCVTCGKLGDRKTIKKCVIAVNNVRLKIGMSRYDNLVPREGKCTKKRRYN